jgi:RNA polymerase sigma factor (sigma-70 family)
MGSEPLKGVVHNLRAHLGEAPTDLELLGRYAREHDQAAFAALVRRHGSLVLAVARRQLADLQQAEDVFQATFLALARSGTRLRKRTSLVNWLYTVAFRQARKARLRQARRAAREKAIAPPSPPVDPLAEISGRELMGLIDDEVAALPERYRLPLLLCVVQGLSREEAAEHLGWSAGAVKGRLERGRRLLAARLAQRGLAPSTLLLAPLGAVAVPNDLLARTVALAASPWSASLPAAIVTLVATGVPRRLPLLGALAGSLLVAGLTGLALGVGGREATLTVLPPSTRAPPASAPPVVAGSPAAAAVVPAGGRLPPGALRRFGGDRFRITGWPLASALSPDGTRLAVLASVQGGNHVTLTVCEADTGRPVSQASIESASFFGTPRLAFSPDGRYVAAAISPDIRAVWTAETGELVTKLPASRFTFCVCQFTPEGLLVGADAKQTSLYEVPSGRVAKNWPVGRIARLTPDTTTFVRVDREFDTISIGDAATGTIAGTLAVKTADNGADNGLAFSADGAKLAAVHDRKRMQIWDVAARKKLNEVQIPDGLIEVKDPYYTVSFSPDGATVVLETKTGRIERWDARSLASLPGLDVAGSAPAGLRRQRGQSGTIYIRGVHWSKDGRTIVAAAGNGLVQRWDAATGKRLPDHSFASHPHFALTRDGAHLVIGDHVGRIEVWNVVSGRLVRQLARGDDRPHALTSLAISPDGLRVAVGEEQDKLRLFHIHGGEDAELTCPALRARMAWMMFLAWAPDGKSVFADATGMVLARLNLADGKAVWTAADWEMAAHALAPDGRFVVRAVKQDIRFLDASTGDVVRTISVALTQDELRRHRPVRAFAFVPDGSRFAAAIGADVLTLFDFSGRVLRRFTATDPPRPLNFNAQRFGMQQKRHSVEALAFTPDGRWLVSGADDLSVKVWEAATGKLIARFDGHDSNVWQVVVAPDGRSAFSAGGDGFVCQWDLTPKLYAGPRQKLDDLWIAAAEPDPAFAVPAAWALITRSTESRAFVANKLPPCVMPKREEVANWLAALDSQEFADREAATKALAAQGRLVEEHLRATLNTTKSLEVRRRAERLLLGLETAYTAEELRALRLVQACELHRSKAAHALLERWAGGATGALLTEEANSAIARCCRR